MAQEQIDGQKPQQDSAETADTSHDCNFRVVVVTDKQKST